MGYEINYNDDKLKSIESEKNAALSEVSQTYDGMINESDKFYQAQIDASKEWKETQSKLQQEQNDFTIEKIEQQKEQAEKDYKKEQSAAYVDWQKQSGQYGVNAEQTAAAGLQRSGYSESSQVAMYNAYQNRVSVARESFNQALLGFTNAMKDAQLQNSSALAEIAFQAYERQAELALQGFQHKNSLIIEKANKKAEVDDRYYTRYQDRVAQLYEDRAFNEQVRQFNASLAEEQRQFSIKNIGNGGTGTITKDDFESSILSESEFKKQASLITRGGRGNTGNGGFNLNGKIYSNYENYVSVQLRDAYSSGKINETDLIALLDKYGL